MPVLLDGLERYVRGQANRRSILILLVVLLGCVIQFYGRSQVLKKVPDKYFSGISLDQLNGFIRDPAKQSGKPQPFLIYYATTEATTDVAFPIVYGTLIGISLWAIFGRKGRWRLLLPLTIVICDLTENATMIWLSLQSASHVSNFQIPSWSTWPTNIKWGFAFVAILIVGFGLIKKLTTRSLPKH